MSEGWHDDPFGRYAQRYHDGNRWTTYVSNAAGVTEQDPLGAEAPPPGAGGLPTAPPITQVPAGTGRLDGFPATPGHPVLRWLARILDVVILGVPLFLLMNAIYGFTDDWVFDFEEGIAETPIPVEVYVAWFVAFAVYEIGMIGAVGRTVGKMICGLTVVRRDGTAIPGYGQAAIRFVVTLVYQTPFLPIIGFALLIATIVMAFATPLRQTLHDKAASTVVAKTSSLRS